MTGSRIAWAVVEAIHEDNRCRCLFATHYHELTRLAERCDALSLHHVRAREWKGDLVLLHELADGPADRSYGLAVARLAGRAASDGRARQGGARQAGGGPRQDRRAGGGARRSAAVRCGAVEAEEEECDAIRAELDALDVDALTPREALDVLYRLKTLARATADRLLRWRYNDCNPLGLGGVATHAKCGSG